MFSKRITNSARFLTMPLTTQALYFHLGMAADDDGVVEAFTVLRMANLNEDDLNLLLAKGFVQKLNEELVLFISDWRENNFLRADRKRDSLYKELLQKTIPYVNYLEAKPRADRKKGKDVSGTSNGLPKISKDKVNNYISCSSSDERDGEKRGQQRKLEDDFEMIYQEYPRKVGKQGAFKAYRQYVTVGRKINGRTYRLTGEQIWDAVKRYADEMTEEGRRVEHIAYASTFFNSQILDYLPLEDEKNEGDTHAAVV